MRPLTNDNHAPTTAAADSTGSPSQNHLQVQGQERVIVLTEENFFEALHDMFQHAERPHCCSWEAHLYRPWGYILTAWCLTFSRRRMSVTCGAQWPFLHRMDGLEKVLGYVYPDFVLLLSKDGLGAIFLIVEIKPLPRTQWNTLKGKANASVSLAKAMEQTRAQAKIAFLQHKDQSSIQAFLACGVWWLAIRYYRSDLLGEDTPSGDGTLRPTVTNNPSGKRRAKRLRRSRRNKPNKKIKDARQSNVGADDDPPRWLSEGSDSEPQSGYISDDEDDDGSHLVHRVAGSDGGKFNNSGVVLPTTGKGHRAIYHIMQLGADKAALNPWFKAFLASVISSFPDISTNDLQKSWFDQTEEERNLGYIWRQDAGRPHDEGFAPGFKLPTGEDLPATADGLTDGVNILLQADGSANTIALNMDVDADTDLASLAVPHLRLPGHFEALSREALDELTLVLAERLNLKQSEGFQPSDFATPRSSANRAFSSAEAPIRPVQHTIRAADRRALPLASSSAFDSDAPFPSSPSPHDQQRDHEGFAIPSLPSRHHISSAQSHSPTFAINVPKSVVASAQRSGTRPPGFYRLDLQPPGSGPYDAFHRALRDDGSAPPRDLDLPAFRPSTDYATDIPKSAVVSAQRSRPRPPSVHRPDLQPHGSGPYDAFYSALRGDGSAPHWDPDPAATGRAHEPRAGARTLNRPPEYRNPFAAASDIPTRQQTGPRVRAHSVAGVTRPHDFASDSDSTTPRASGSGFGAGIGSATQQFRGKWEGWDSPMESEPRWTAYPKATRGEFSARSTSYVLEVPMRLGAPKKREQPEQEGNAEAGTDSSRDARAGDEGSSQGGGPANKGKGRA